MGLIFASQCAGLRPELVVRRCSKEKVQSWTKHVDSFLKFWHSFPPQEPKRN